MIRFVLILENLFPYHKSDIYAFLKYFLKTFFLLQKNQKIKINKKKETKQLSSFRIIINILVYISLEVFLFIQ